jgi:hypothetical protein
MRAVLSLEHSAGTPCEVLSFLASGFLRGEDVVRSLQVSDVEIKKERNLTMKKEN